MHLQTPASSACCGAHACRASVPGECARGITMFDCTARLYRAGCRWYQRWSPPTAWAQVQGGMCASERYKMMWGTLCGRLRAEEPAKLNVSCLQCCDCSSGACCSRALQEPGSWALQALVLARRRHASLFIDSYLHHLLSLNLRAAASF